MNQPKKPRITTWRQFTAQIRSKGHGLLKTLDDFPNAVLVTGCQRSGTTMMSRIITQSEGMVDYWTGPDDELDAALILSGSNHRPVPADIASRPLIWMGLIKSILNIQAISRSSGYCVTLTPWSLPSSIIGNRVHWTAHSNPFRSIISPEKTPFSIDYSD